MTLELYMQTLYLRIIGSNTDLPQDAFLHHSDFPYYDSTNLHIHSFGSSQADTFKMRYLTTSHYLCHAPSVSWTCHLLQMFCLPLEQGFLKYSKMKWYKCYTILADVVNHYCPEEMNK